MENIVPNFLLAVKRERKRERDEKKGKRKGSHKLGDMIHQGPINHCFLFILNLVVKKHQ